MHRHLLFAFLLAGCASAPARSPAPQSIELLVAATTDVHGWLRGWDYYANAPDTTRGLARAATIVDSLRTAHPGRVVLVDAGDLLQGNPLAYTAARVSSDTLSPIVGAMNVMRYDAAAIGNHEFNYGVPFLDRAVAQARFPFLSANTYRVDGARKYRAWTMVERNGVRIAIVGGTTPGVNVWDRDNIRGRVTVRAIVPDVRASVVEARAAGADVVIVVLHSGLGGASSYDSTATASENVTAQVAREVQGIDLIVFGHSHREVADTTIGGALLVQPRNWAGSVAVAHLELRREAGRWTVAAKRGETIPAVGRRESEAVLLATANAHAEAVAYVSTPVGRTTVAWRADSSRVKDTPIVDFILETQRRVAGTQLASGPAFSLEASLDTGAITVAELARLYPYDNTLRAIRITGKQLREYLEFSARYFGTTGTSEPAVDPRVPGYNYDMVAGADYTIDVSRPIGSRITRLEVGGRPVRDDASFTLALHNYRQTGGGGYAMLAGAPMLSESTGEIRQLLIEEVKRRGTLEPADVFQRNWELVPTTAIGPAYAAMQRRTIARTPTTSASTAPVRQLPARVRIIATNDFHGTLEPRVDARGIRRGGAGAVAAVIERAKQECTSCAVVLLDGGDMFQGTAASNLVFGRSVVAIYDALGYAAAALGNHEFDWGQDTLRARMREARYAILGANVKYADGRDVPWIRDDTIVSAGPVRVGIIGVSTVETPRTTLAANVSDLRFVDPVPVVVERARSLRERGAHLVVVVAHAGAFCDNEGDDRCAGEIVELARGAGRAVDAIVSGHTHSLVRAHEAGVPIVQARSNGRAVGVLDLVPGEIPVVAVRDVLTDSIAPSARVDSIARAAVAAVAPRVSARIAEVSRHLQRSGEQYPLGQLIADAQRWAAKADVAVMNNGGIRADLPAGTATYGRIFEVQPFANTLHRFTLRGSDLRAYLEKLVAGRTPPRVHVSGVTLTYDPKRPPGQRLVSATLATGHDIVPDREYALVMNNFMATGGDGLGLGTQAIRSEPLPIIDLDALIDYMKQLPQPVQAPDEKRIVEVGS